MALCTYNQFCISFHCCRYWLGTPKIPIYVSKKLSISINLFIDLSIYLSMHIFSIFPHIFYIFPISLLSIYMIHCTEAYRRLRHDSFLQNLFSILFIHFWLNIKVCIKTKKSVLFFYFILENK